MRARSITPIPDHGHTFEKYVIWSWCKQLGVQAGWQSWHSTHDLEHAKAMAKALVGPVRIQRVRQTTEVIETINL
jgi:hypothetical protein